MTDGDNCGNATSAVYGRGGEMDETVDSVEMVKGSWAVAHHATNLRQAGPELPLWVIMQKEYFLNYDKNKSYLYVGLR